MLCSLYKAYRKYRSYKIKTLQLKDSHARDKPYTKEFSFYGKKMISHAGANLTENISYAGNIPYREDISCLAISY